MTSPDAFEMTAMAYFGLASLEDFEALNSLKEIPEQDRIEVGVYFGMALVRTDDHCIDNFRIFAEVDSDQYNDIQQMGCCGSFDGTITCQSGITYLVGFNYGH